MTDSAPNICTFPGNKLTFFASIFSSSNDGGSTRGSLRAWAKKTDEGLREPEWWWIREGVACKWSINLRYARTWLEPKFPTPTATFRVQGMTWPGTNTLWLKPTLRYKLDNFAEWSENDCSWWRKGWFPSRWRTGLNVTNHSVSLTPSHYVLLLMAALACGYDPHWPLRHKMCEGNQGLVSYIRAAVIGSQRSLVPLNYPLTQPGLLGLCGGALPAAPPNWCVPPGAFKPHKASCSWGVRLH